MELSVCRAEGTTRACPHLSIDWYTSWEVHNSRSSTGPGTMKKSRRQQIIANLPESVDVNDLIERLHLLDKIEQAEKQLARGEGVPHETSKQRLSQWLQ